MENQGYNFTLLINGTTFMVNLKQADGAKLTFEEIIRKMISNEAVTLQTEEVA